MFQVLSGEVTPLAKTNERASYRFVSFTFSSTLSIISLLGDILSSWLVFVVDLVKLGHVLCGQHYSGNYYRGLIDLSVVWQCRKYGQNYYHCRIEHPLVSRIMVIEFN
jgi:hypothetical protein